MMSPLTNWDPELETPQPMVYAPPKSRLPWEDRFKTPSVQNLREPYNKQLSNLLDTAREQFLSVTGVEERISWQGVAWRWTLTYQAPDDPTRAWVYLIPHPEGPRIAMPMTEEMVEALPKRRLKKFVTDGITSARRVGAMHWAVWEITNKTNLDDVMDLARRKLKSYTPDD